MFKVGDVIITIETIEHNELPDEIGRIYNNIDSNGFKLIKGFKPKPHLHLWMC